MIDRRLFVFGLAAAPWPGTTAASARGMARVGFLHSGSPVAFQRAVEGFRSGLSAEGFEIGRNIDVSYRWAEGRYDRLPSMAAELLSSSIDVLVATGGSPAVRAARDATATIPIVFSTSDPVGEGFVSSISRPGGNITGVNLYTGELVGKRLQLLAELVGGSGRIGYLINPNYPAASRDLAEATASASRLGRELFVISAGEAGSIEGALGGLPPDAAGLVVGNDPFFFGQRDLIVQLVNRLRVPAVFELREFAESGGLMSYGANIREVYRQVGTYTGAILKGSKPADMPVFQVDKFQLSVNLKTAQSLGLTIPPAMLLRADEVIE